MPRRRTPELEANAAKLAQSRAERLERCQLIRSALAAGIPLAQFKAQNPDLWPDNEAGRMRWRRDYLVVCPPEPKPVAPVEPGRAMLVAERERLVLLPALPCARIRHSTMLDPIAGLELPGERNSRLWDGRAGTTEIVPVGEIRNAATRKDAANAMDRKGTVLIRAELRGVA